MLWNTQRQKVIIKDEKQSLQKLCTISDVVCKWNKVLQRKRDGKFEKNRKSDVWYEAIWSKK